MQTDTLLVALVRQFFQNIPLERGGIHNIVIGKACVEHGKAIVMPGCEADVLCPGCLDGRYPFGRIELGRIKAARQLGILLIIQILVRHGPFSGSQHAVYPPMQENTETAIPKLLTGFQIFLRRLISLRLCGGHKEQQQ